MSTLDQVLYPCLIASTALTVGFDPSTYEVIEGEAANIMVVLSNPADREVTVMFDTQDGSAGGKWLMPSKTSNYNNIFSLMFNLFKETSFLLVCTHYRLVSLSTTKTVNNSVMQSLFMCRW